MRAARSHLLAAALATVLAGCGGLRTDLAPPSPECAACHLADYRSVTHPPHAGVKPTKCAVCHASYEWRPSRLEHAFPLTGAHAQASCFGCHRGTPAVFEGTPKACVACHRADYDRSTFPGHSRFPLTCDDCHSTSAWKPPLPTFVPHEQASGGAAGADARAARPAPVKPRTTPAPTPAPVTTPVPRPRPTANRPRPVPTTPPNPDSVSGGSRRR